MKTATDSQIEVSLRRMGLAPVSEAMLSVEDETVTPALVSQWARRRSLRSVVYAGALWVNEQDLQKAIRGLPSRREGMRRRLKGESVPNGEMIVGAEPLPKSNGAPARTNGTAPHMAEVSATVREAIRSENLPEVVRAAVDRAMRVTVPQVTEVMVHVRKAITDAMTEAMRTVFNEPTKESER